MFLHLPLNLMFGAEVCV